MTKEELLNLGFKETYNQVFHRGEFEKAYKDRDGRTVFVTLTYGLSNMIGRDWFCHIDNDYRETIGSFDIQTVDQLRTLLELADVVL